MRLPITCYSLKEQCECALPPSIFLCLGNFDGVHKAHRVLLQKALSARDHGFPNAACGVFCFREPPTLFLQGKAELLCTLSDKLDIFAACGMEYVLLASFEDICNLSPDAFLRDLLQDTCHCIGAVCGFNYRFGKNRAGDTVYLTKAAPFPTYVCDPVTEGDAPISSTRIRSLLKAGDVKGAAAQLTRPFSFTSPVLHGKSLGRHLGAPTVNQCFPKGLLTPCRGVYVTACTVDGKTYRAVSNVGLRPTVDKDDRINCESYLLDFSGDLYGKDVTVSFLDFIRPEQKFTSIEELQAQIQRDIEAARSY